MLCSLAPENAIQYLGLHVVTLKFGLVYVLSNLACMYSWAKKRGHLVFLNSSVKNLPILAIFSTLKPEETLHQMITYLSIAPVKCSHCTLFSETNTACG